MIMKKYFLGMSLLAASLTGIIGCQKMSRPALGDYPVDHTVTPTTPLRFYANFDSTTEAGRQINIRFGDSISEYPSFFPPSSISVIDGIHGTAFKNSGDATLLQYLNANDWPSSTSFTVAFWEKHDGVPAGEAQFAFSIPSSNGHWSGGTMFLLFDHPGAGATNDLAVIKFFMVDPNGEGWMEWVGANRVPGIYDNQWHHLAFTYDETTSQMKLYKDGALHGTANWTGHGGLHIETSKIGVFNLGGRPKVDLGWGRSWIGGLDQFRLYNKVLSAAEISALYTNKQ